MIMAALTTVLLLGYFWLMVGAISCGFIVGPPCFGNHPDESVGNWRSILKDRYFWSRWSRHVLLWPVALWSCRVPCEHGAGHYPCALLRDPG